MPTLHKRNIYMREPFEERRRFGRFFKLKTKTFVFLQLRRFDGRQCTITIDLVFLLPITNRRYLTAFLIIILILFSIIYWTYSVNS